MNFRKQSKVEAAGFQLAPMIDVMFILLFFFIATQIYARWEQEVSITVPTAETGSTSQRLPGEIIINIHIDGRYIVNNVTFSAEELGERLKWISANYPGQPVILRGDQKTAYEHVIRVLDLCRQAKMWNISFATTGVTAESS